MASVCENCGTSGAEFLCSRCKASHYCGPECFRKAWKTHKPNCRAPEQPAAATASIKPEQPPAKVKASVAPAPPQPSPKSDPVPLSTPPSTTPSAKKAQAPAKAASKASIDYSKFDNIEDSDEELANTSPSHAAASGSSGSGLLMATQKPTDKISLSDYCSVFEALLKVADPPALCPDLQNMFTAFKSCPDTTDRALFDQAVYAVEGIPATLSDGKGGLEAWKQSTQQLCRAMMTQQRYDEARMWCLVRHMREPLDLESLQVHAWCLEFQTSLACHAGSPKVQFPTVSGSRRAIDLDEYVVLSQNSMRACLRQIVKVGKSRKNVETLRQLHAAYAGLSTSLERSGEIEEARKIGREATELGYWATEWQRAAHICRSLLPGTGWHDAKAMQICAALEQGADKVKEEFQRYMDLGKPLQHVGTRTGEYNLVEQGTWKELPLFNDGRLDHEVCLAFPETVRMLTERCADATGLAFCGGGEVAFRILSPGTRLKPHCGPTNVRLTCYLGVSVPLGAEPGISIGGAEPRPWVDGGCSVFDDSFEHFEELDEMAEGDCVVLMLHFWHPAFEHKNDHDWKQKSLQ